MALFYGQTPITTSPQRSFVPEPIPPPVNAVIGPPSSGDNRADTQGIEESLIKGEGSAIDASATPVVRPHKIDQRFLSQILDLLPLAIFVKDVRGENFGRHLLWNHQCEVLLEISAQEALGKTAYDLFPQEEADFLIERDRLIFAQGEREEITCEVITSKTLGRRYIHTNKIPLVDDQGNPEYLVCFAEDITDRVELEAEIANNATMFRKMTALIPGMVFQFGIKPEGEYFLTFVSDGAQELYEISPEEIKNNIGLIFNLVKPEQVPFFQAAIEESRQNLTEFLFEYEITTHNGHHKWLKAHSVPYVAANNTILWNGLVVDITEYKLREIQLEEAIRKADNANQAKTNFLANMSHEIRTPINAILGFTELLKDNAGEQEQRSQLELVYESGQNLLAIINDILDLSKIEADKLSLNYQGTNIPKLIINVVKIFRLQIESKNINVFLNFDDCVFPEIYIDPIRLRQILFNLIGNAVKFTDQGGIKIYCFNEYQGSELGNSLIIAVEDTGIGMTPPQQEKIFEAFSQVHDHPIHRYGGTGLGLTITRRLVELMNGSIAVTSELGQGSTFTLTFNSITIYDPQQDAPINKAVDLSVIPPATILVIDYEGLYLSKMNSLILDTPHAILAARDLSTAINQYKNFLPHYIVVNLTCPNAEMDAIAQLLAQRTSSPDRPIPIFVITEELPIPPIWKELAKDKLSVDFSSQELAQAFIRYPAHYPDQNHNYLELNQKSHPILKSKLKGELDRWKTMRHSMIIPEIRQFIGMLHAWADKYESELLTDYTVELRRKIDMFDIEGLNREIKKFPQIIEQI
jgi:PAS domain S-box-containing protein